LQDPILPWKSLDDKLAITVVIPILAEDC